MKKILGVLLSIMALSLVACGTKTENSAPDTGDTPIPTLNETTLEMSVSETFTLIVNDYDGEVEWSVSDYRVLEIEDGVVTCVGVGEATVTAQAGETILTCMVTGAIDYDPVPYIVLDGEIAGKDGEYSLNLLVGDTYALEPSLYIATERVENITFTLTATGVSVEIEGLTLKAVAAVPVLVVITCEYEGETYTAYCEVTVSGV